MATYLSHIIGKEHVILSTERTLFWDSENTLIIADLHVDQNPRLGKAGMKMLASDYPNELNRLLAQLLFFKADRLIITGDLTHTPASWKMDSFRKWRKRFPSLEVHFTRVNRIPNKKWYEEADIKIHHDPFAIKQFLFVRDIMYPRRIEEPGNYFFSGHVHPGIRIKEKRKHGLRFPCFYFTRSHCILPAFSPFSKTYRIEPKKGEQVFAIVENEIIPLSFKK